MFPTPGLQDLRCNQLGNRLAPMGSPRRMKAQRTMRPIRIIVPPPGFNHHPRFSHAVKALGIVQFPPKRPIQTFVTPILRRILWRNPTWDNPLIFEKREQRLRHQLRPMITPDIPSPRIASHQPLHYLDGLSMGQ